MPRRFVLLLVLMPLFALVVWSQQVTNQPQVRSATGTPSAEPPQLPGYTPPTSTLDPQAVQLLQQTIAAMGGASPVDSVATGTVNVVAGSSKEDGTITIDTRGTNQSSEQEQFSDHSYSEIYSRGQANGVLNDTAKSSSLELAASMQTPDFPLPLFAAIQNDPDLAMQYVGAEMIDDTPVQHIKIWKTFASKPKLQAVWELTTKDIWLDSATGLPRKLAFVRREARGAAPRFAIEIDYSNWQNVSGILYPYTIQKSWNGTPWTTITIQSVTFQTGLTDSSFPITSNTGVNP